MIKTGTKTHKCFTTCDLKIEQPKSAEISSSTFFEVWRFGVEYKFFLKSRMAAFQAFDKIDNLDEKCCYMILSELEN